MIDCAIADFPTKTHAKNKENIHKANAIILHKQTYDTIILNVVHTSNPGLIPSPTFAKILIN